MKYLITTVLFLTACAGPRGPEGAPGTQGAVGTIGPQGPAGQDGTEIIPIKFCDDEPHYPSTFPEYGLCINGQLFAVYSANDGFLALIPDGLYLSTAVGSTCTFRVNGCEVSR